MCRTSRGAGFPTVLSFGWKFMPVGYEPGGDHSPNATVPLPGTADAGNGKTESCPKRCVESEPRAGPTVPMFVQVTDVSVKVGTAEALTSFVPVASPCPRSGVP